MGFRPVSQRLRDINLQALGKFSCLALVLGLESVSHPADGPARARAEMWNVGLSGAVSVRDELRWVF